MTHNASCSTIKAQAWACHPQTDHSMLLAIKQQKPTMRRPGRCDPIHQAATTVTSMAGHSSKSIQLSIEASPKH
ncbi:hypothetical protein BGP82_14235 [Pseudomonas putida]|uniref:Uncharacterized protein n=1 Tax=Pseudomonas putida TaxID=303 RepID=A0A2S3WTB3_PSEPU|nr:hypothetical protein BGP83_16230 [Pseudomonas putida]POG04666.1 hypothetical protein BGP82_14235 [Pseudomonas putida]